MNHQHDALAPIASTDLAAVTGGNFIGNLWNKAKTAVTQGVDEVRRSVERGDLIMGARR